MKPIIHRFTLDMHSTQSQISIPALLGDTGRALHINLSDGGKPYFIEDGCLAKLSVKRPTGTRLEEFCTIEDNMTIVYSFDQNVNTAAVEGIHDCDVTLYDLNGTVITSPRLTIIVSERVVRSDDIVLTDEDLTAVDAMLSKEAERQTSEAERKAAEAERKAAEAERKAAEEIRETTYKHTLEEAGDAKEMAASAKESADEVEKIAGNTREALSKILEIQGTLVEDYDGIESGKFQEKLSAFEVKLAALDARIGQGMLTVIDETAYFDNDMIDGIMYLDSPVVGETIYF